MEINIQSAKIELIQWLTTINDTALIKKILEIKNDKSGDWYFELPENEKKSIELGNSDAEKGKLKPNTEAEKIYGKWL